MSSTLLPAKRPRLDAPNLNKPDVPSPPSSPLNPSPEPLSPIMECYPELLRKVFQPPVQPITSEMVADLFVADFSPIGSNNRAVEETLLMMWIRYLEHIEGIIIIIIR